MELASFVSFNFQSITGVLLLSFIAFALLQLCEWNDENQKYLHIHVPLPAGIQQGVCHGCDRVHLSYQDMNPPGRCSRSLCKGCYERMFKRVNYHCVICGSDISYKVGAQSQNWREIKNHICDDRMCIATWARRHAIVTGKHVVSYQQNTLPPPNYPQVDAYDQPQSFHHQPNVANANASRNESQLHDEEALLRAFRRFQAEQEMRGSVNESEPINVTPRPLSLPEPQPRQIGYQPIQTVDEFFEGDFSSKEEDNVIYVDLTKKNRS